MSISRLSASGDLLAHLACLPQDPDFLGVSPQILGKIVPLLSQLDLPSEHAKSEESPHRGRPIKQHRGASLWSYREF